MSRLHANPPRPRRAAPVARSSWPQTLVRALLVGIAVMLVASSCNDDTENRQFATDPRTPRHTPTVAVVDMLPATPESRVVPLASPEALVDRRGAPHVVYGQIGGSLTAITRDGAEALTDARVAAIAASPSGRQVAILVPAEGGGAFGLEIYSASGELEQRIDDVFTPPVAATPADAASAQRDDGVALSWSPQGQRLLLAHSSGELLNVSLDGTVELIETRSPISGITEALWSPRGDQLGVVFHDDDGFGSLALIDPGQRPARVIVIAPVGRVSGERASVESFAWKPYGDGVLFLQGNPADDGDGVRHGQIVSWDQASNTTQVMATGGQVGPTGSIRQFTIAPDGKAIAYVVDIRTPDGWVFGGLYVRSLRFAQVFRVPVGPDVAVTNVWWLGDGLAWLGTAESEGASSVQVRWIDATGERVAIADIATAPIATPAATPVIGTPGASPVAPPTGVATPAVTAVDTATPTG